MPSSHDQVVQRIEALDSGISVLQDLRRCLLAKKKLKRKAGGNYGNEI